MSQVFVANALRGIEGMAQVYYGLIPHSLISLFRYS